MRKFGVWECWKTFYSFTFKIDDVQANKRIYRWPCERKETKYLHRIESEGVKCSYNSYYSHKRTLTHIHKQIYGIQSMHRNI